MSDGVTPRVNRGPAPLTDEQRVVSALKEFGDMGHGEIAAKLGLNVLTVVKILNRLIEQGIAAKKKHPDSGRAIFALVG